MRFKVIVNNAMLELFRMSEKAAKSTRSCVGSSRLQVLCSFCHLGYGTIMAHVAGSHIDKSGEQHKEW